ncbi:MAG: hypothetical protein IJ557_02640 [Bacteroidaceae bacterium]|nr:hypothetical protein [Bacteroidaceae bacterium]
MIEQKKIQKWLNATNRPIKQNGATNEDLALLRTVMEAHGMHPSLFYNRVAYIGFEPWEAFGIKDSITEFANKLAVKDSTIEVCTDSIDQFWNTLKSQGLHPEFYRYMAELGMSRMTVKKRFEQGKFKPWELIGWCNILRTMGQEDTASSVEETT